MYYLVVSIIYASLWQARIRTECSQKLRQSDNNDDDDDDNHAEWNPNYRDKSGLNTPTPCEAGVTIRNKHLTNTSYDDCQLAGSPLERSQRILPYGGPIHFGY
jgi:hypothetical protein